MKQLTVLNTCTYSYTVMDPVHREILRRHRLELSDQIAVSDTIVHFLYQENVLTHGHVEEIQVQPTSRSRALRLLDLLPSRGPRAFDAFLRSLEEEFIWVKDTLLHDLESQHTADGQPPKDNWHLPEEALLTVPSDRELSRLASRLGPEWEALLLDLGLSTGELFRCRADHVHSTHGQALAGLVKWRQSQGKAATVHRLVQSLQAVDIHPTVLEELFHQ